MNCFPGQYAVSNRPMAEALVFAYQRSARGKGWGVSTHEIGEGNVGSMAFESSTPSPIHNFTEVIV